MPQDISHLASRHAMPFRERIEEGDIDPSYLERFPLAFLKNNLILPMKREDGKLMVAIATPDALFALDDIAKACTIPVAPVFAPDREILNTINRYFERLSASAKEVIDELNGESLESIANQWNEPKDLLEFNDDAPIIKLLNSILFQAVKERASDIHIEPFERQLEVRFRLDGILYSILSPPKSIQESIVSRIKVMAGLDIAEKRLPQDGRIRLLVAGKDVDVRVSIVPTAFGERAVLRLLDRKAGLINLSDIGLNKYQTGFMERALTANNGIILVTGPTGSGKTTTLYASINRINSHERNIITIEDPIEYQLNGIGQMQVNPKIGLTFASGLRSILRQDPDVIMVGEIRDHETAKMAIQASLTGHLVLSTLHTNDAPSAVIRLVDMGIEPYLLSSSISAVIAQRLIRLLCPHCREEYIPHKAECELFNDPPPEKLWRAAGCERCFKRGYKGQTAIFELLKIDQSLRSLLLKNPDSTTVKKYALSVGMKTLREDGLEKVKNGISSLEEVLRVTDLG